MRPILILFICLITTGLQSQHTISGTFSPSKDYKWLLSYQLKPGSQEYVASAEIKEGNFSMTIPENKPGGVYRLVYAVPQEEFYFDVIYNGKEDVKLFFDTKGGVQFIDSKENLLYNNYLKEIISLEKELIGCYSFQGYSKKELSSISKQLKERQLYYEKQSKGLIANNFIVANAPYIPLKNETAQEYVTHKKQQYFRTLDFTNPILQASNFLTDRTLNYIFSAFPLDELNAEEKEVAIQENVDFVDTLVKEVQPFYKTQVYYSIWTEMIASKMTSSADFVYNKYLKKLAEETKNVTITEKIEVYNRLRLGVKAPEITWENNSLSGLSGAEYYLLVFWSSTCSHCLKELPALHKELKDNSAVKVIAIGMEDNDITWKKESAKLGDFAHVISLGKWQSKYAELYVVRQTPTYFVLDKDKRIIAKPEDDKAVIAFLEDVKE